MRRVVDVTTAGQLVAALPVLASALSVALPRDGSVAGAFLADAPG